MKPLLNRLSNLFLLILSVVSLIALITDSFSCTAEPSLLFWLLTSCLLLWYAGSFRRGFWVGMPLSAVLLYGAYRFYDADPALQLSDFLDRIAGAFYTHVTQPGMAYPYAGGVQSHSLILLFLGFLLAAYGITALTSKSARIALSLLGTLPIFAACVVVNGEIPALACAGMLLFWFLLFVTGSGFSPEGNSGRTLLCCLLPICLLLGGLLLLHRPEDYVYTERDYELSRRFDRLGHYFDLLTGVSASQAGINDPDDPNATSGPRSRFQSSWDSDDDSMDLEQEYDFDHTKLPILRVQTVTSGRLYLRIKSFGDYVGTGWAPAEELSAGSSLPFTAFAAAESAEGTARELEIRTYADLDGLCLPYYAPVSKNSDAFVDAEGQDSYRIAYTEYRGKISDLRLPDSAVAAEQVYRDHAHSVYTRLPDDTREAALRICQEAGLRADSPDLIAEVAAYVRESAEYDLNTASYPSQDYAIYFLTQSHRGYCIHYATAAAVLYRALGVPARVTEGFMVDVSAGRSTEVLAGNAHAWVEIYMDGVGWIPVEVTTQGTGVATQEEPASPSPEPTPEPSSAPEETEGPGGGSAPESPASAQEETPETVSTEEISPEIAPRPFPWQILWIFMALLLPFPLWYAASRARFLSQIRNPDNRKAAIACWRYAEKVKVFGAETPELIIQTAEKAAFSPHMIRRDEVEQCRSALRESIEAVYPGLRPLQKLRFRYLRGLK